LVRAIKISLWQLKLLKGREKVFRIVRIFWAEEKIYGREKNFSR
jgi:hypothetical protein